MLQIVTEVKVEEEFFNKNEVTFKKSRKIIKFLKGKGNDYKEQVSRIDFDSLKPYYVKDFIQAKTLSEAKQQFLTLKDGVYKLSVPFHIESFDILKILIKNLQSTF